LISKASDVHLTRKSVLLKHARQLTNVQLNTRLGSVSVPKKCHGKLRLSELERRKLVCELGFSLTH